MKFFIWVVMICFCGNTLAAPVCNIGANPWEKGRQTENDERKYRISIPVGEGPILVQSMDGDNHLSSTCELEDGTIIVVRDGFETEKEYPKLAILSTDNVFTVRRKLKQYPWIYACGNPILTPFEFEVLEGTENEEAPDARILIQGGTGNINVSGPNNVVNVVFPDYRPVDSYRPRERAKVEGICDGWCVAGRIAIGVVVAGLIYSLTRDKGSSSPAPTAPQGNTGGSGNGGTPPQGDTGGTTGGGTPSGD